MSDEKPERLTVRFGPLVTNLTDAELKELAEALSEPLVMGVMPCPGIRDYFERVELSDEEVKEMEKNGMISLDNTPPEDETKCASEDQLEEHACKRFSDCACQAKAKSEWEALTGRVFDGQAQASGITKADVDAALKAFRDGGCCGN